MQIYVRMKMAGKRKDILKPMPYQIPDEIQNLRQLLTAVVESEIERYIQKQNNTSLMPYLTDTEIDTEAYAGKVSFGEIYSERTVDKEKSIENAIQCWKDGLIRVFVNDMEIVDLEDALRLKEDDVLTFIRLTFLTGLIW